MKCKLGSLYLCVKDMDRAVAFYEALLGQPAVQRDEIYSVFDIGGFRMGLFAFEKKNEPHTFGSNCLPSIGWEGLDMLKDRLEGQTLCFPLTRIGPNWVAEIVDSEGNHVEMTAPAKEGDA